MQLNKEVDVKYDWNLNRKNPTQELHRQRVDKQRVPS